MTSAWFTMLHGHRDPALSAMPAAAEAYLLFAPDTPWVADGTRQFVGRDRVAFHKVILGEIWARGIAPIIISGNWEQRRDALHDIITARLDMDAASSS
jgi:nicotinamide riboside kinase